MGSEGIFVVLFVLGLMAFTYRRLHRYLHLFQQDGYNSKRFLSWLVKHRAFDRRGTYTVLLGIVICIWLGAYLSSAHLLALLVTGALFLFVGLAEENPKKSGKVKLKMTSRANRIIVVAAAILALLESIILAVLAPDSFLSLPELTPVILISGLLISHLIPFAIILANFVLEPVESHIQQTFLEEAKSKLFAINPLVIGITGSYGKTSTKSALGELLDASLGKTFWPPASFNTPMGITRQIREQLQANTKFAVIEMGAYGIGSISRLCALTPPKAGIITSIGVMHLDRFGSEENIYKAKSELAQAIPSDGILVCNGDNSGARRIASEFARGTTLLYGFDTSSGPLDCLASNLTFDGNETVFQILWRGETYRVVTKLTGVPAISNLLGAFTMAAALGASPELLVAAIRNLKPVENRISISHANGITYINDAYNSNPVGFNAALETLKSFSGSKKLLMTPGMIELGEKQFSENKEVGVFAGGICTHAVIVGDTNKEALVRGLREGGLGEEFIYCASNREEGFSYIGKHAVSGDVVLIENDLPDLYEPEVRF